MMQSCKHIVQTIFLSCFLFASLPTNAQTWSWVKSAGGIGYESGNAICADSVGHVYVAGSFGSPSISFGPFTLSRSGATDMFLTKYDASGNVLWARSAGGTNTTEATSIVTDVAGNVYVTGYFSGPGLMFDAITLSNAGLSDIFWVKYDTAGNVVWAKSAGGAQVDYPASIATDAKGNVFLTGNYSSDTLTFGAIGVANRSGMTDIFIAKYDAAGNTLWAKSIGGQDDDYAKSLSTDGSGSVYIAGGFNSRTINFDTITLNNFGGEYIFLSKYDSSGKAIWAKTSVNIIGGNLVSDEINAISSDKYENVYASGHFFNPLTIGTTTLTNMGADDIFLIKYSASGNVLWAKSAGGIGVDNPTSIATDASGSVYLTGTFRSDILNYGSSILYNNGNDDIFIAKYDSLATLLWAKSVGNTGYDRSLSIATDNNDVYVSGKFGSPTLSFDAVSVNNNSDTATDDMFLAKMSKTTGSPIIIPLENSIAIYPNPATAALSISSTNKITSLIITNLIGQTIYTHNHNSEKVQVDVAGLPKGVYLIRINGTQVRKFVKE